jgi:hypothetical protein
VAVETATTLPHRRSGRPTNATARRRPCVCRSLPKCYCLSTFIFLNGARENRVAISRNTDLSHPTTDASDQTGASPSCWPSKRLCSPGSELVRVNRHPLSPWSVYQ